MSPDVRSSRAKLEALLTEGFVEFGASGRAFDRSSIIEALLTQKAHAEIAISAFKLVRLSNDLALVTYTATARDNSRSSLRSSLWVMEDARWRMRFHQGTPRDS